MKLSPSVAVAVLACSCNFVLTVSGLAEENKPVHLQVGDKAPVFSATDDQGKLWKSSDYVGKKILVVYFYPADLTGGCTKQACGFRDDLSKLKNKDVEVVGVSGDSAANHRQFKKVEKLNFTLLADQDGSIAKAFGVPVSKGGTIIKQIAGQSLSLTRGVTAKRWTFVLGKDGTIIHKDTKVKAADDSKTILKVVADLQKK